MLKNKEKVIEMFKQGTKLSEIAKKLAITENQLKLLLKNWGVDIRKRQKNDVPRPERGELLRNYALYKTVDGVAKFYKISTNLVLKWMMELNIPTRKMHKMGEREKIEFLERHIEMMDL